MKCYLQIGWLCVIILLTSCQNQVPNPNNGVEVIEQKIMQNASIIYKFTPCGPNPEWYLDTKNDMLLYQPLGQDSIIENKLMLSEEEKEIIIEYAISIDYFSFPSDYRIEKGLCTAVPSSTYEITIVNGLQSNYLFWSDGSATCDNEEKSNKLRKLFKIINAIIIYHAYYMDLPKSDSACA